MGPRTFKKIIDHIFSIRETFRDKGSNSDLWGKDFDFPNYGELPKNISGTFSSEAVDAMQDVLQTKFVRKRDFARAYKNKLKELDEPGSYGKKIT